ncbi:ABC transporter permease [Streptomyces indicus]|uniref:Putative ABC transport system permease protein n=1 Tax=Streptomyces indicus TaxID=417292 RepID=A0A1G9H791_9ACTN|nr:ABC transporter permease [Streptomyces indicus]SDL08644.1 putative ABC transport system permease protein [Streptomyces indicus]
MLRTALRNVLAHKARLVMTALAVMLGVAFVSGTLVFGDTVAGAFRGASAKNLDGVAVAVQDGGTTAAPEAKPGDFKTALDDQLAQRIAALPGADSVRPTVNGRATLAAKDGKPLNADADWQNLAVNYAPGKDGKDPLYPLAKGRAPASSGELALDTKTAEKAGYRVGDTVRFATDGPALTKKLVGLVDTDDPRVTAGGTLALFDTATAQKLFTAPGYYDEITVGARPGTDQVKLTDEVRALLPGEDAATATSGQALAEQQSREIAESTGSLTKALLVFAGIALFVGAFIIANTFTMLIAQRTKEIALMRAVGASRKQVVRSVLVEAALLGLGASAAGFALGLGIASVLPALLNAGGAGLPDGPLIVSPSAFVWSLVVGVVVTVLAAWLPSRKAARIAPVEAMSTVDAPPKTRSLVVRNVAGALLVAGGMPFMLYVAGLDKPAEVDLLTALFGAGLFLLGLIVLAPLLSRPFIALAGRLTQRLYGVSGKLAKENALRNPRRTAATASALMIGLCLITGLTVAAQSADRAVAAEATTGLAADYRISNSAYRGIDRDAAGKVAEVPGVSAAAPLASATGETRGGYLSLTGGDPATLGKVTDLRFTQGALADVGPGKIAVSSELAKERGLRVGSQVEAGLGGRFVDGVRKGATTKTFTVVGVFEKNRTVEQALGTLGDVLPYATDQKLDEVLVKAESGASGLDGKIRDALGNSPLLKVQDRDQIVASEVGAVGTVLNMMYGLLGMAVLIAVLGVVNTLAMSVFERTREIGMLRAIGLDRAGIRQMVRLESVIICLFGAALGIGSGIFLAWLNSGITGGTLPGYETVLPWLRIGLFIVLALVVGVLAAIWPARRAARMDVLGAISAS